MTQAPSRNLDTRTTPSVTPVQSCPGRVDHHRLLRMRPAQSQPVHDHARLRERERQKGPDREQGDQMIGDSAECDQKPRRQHRQDDDALRVDKPAPSVGESAGQKAVGGDHPAKPREIGKAGVGRQCQNAEHRTDRDVVKHPAANHGGHQLRESALVTGLTRLGRADPIGAAQEGDTSQHHRQEADDGRQGALGVGNGRLAKGGHSIADGLNARHGRAAAGKGPHQDPKRSPPSWPRAAVAGASTGTGWPSRQNRS